MSLPENVIFKPSAGLPVWPRPALPDGLIFKPLARSHCDGRPAERWDGEQWVAWDWVNDRELGA